MKETIKFPFEDFLREREEQLPEGLDPVYLKYIQVLEDPIRNIRQVPVALHKLPMNAVLHQSWKSIGILYSLILLFSLPMAILMMYAASLVDNTTTGAVMLFFIYIGSFVSPLYLKYIYGTLNNLIESKKAPWLVKEIKEPFQITYRRPWNRKLLYISLLIPFILDFKLGLIIIENHQFTFFSSIWIILAFIIGHIGISFIFYLALVSYRYVSLNTKLYDKLLVKIIERVRGYTEGHESILTKKNYEVVRVLSDTPGLSIRSLGDIPTFGLGASIFVLNSAIFIILLPYLLDGVGAEFLQGLPKLKDDPTNLTYIILLGIFLSSIAAFGAVIMPLVRISNVMLKFKNKALTELDPFLFDEMTSLALKRDTEISNETQVLYILRSYIYTMKVSPVAPFRLIYVVLITLAYGSRFIPYFLILIGRGGA